MVILEMYNRTGCIHSRLNGGSDLSISALKMRNVSVFSVDRLKTRKLRPCLTFLDFCA